MEPRRRTYLPDAGQPLLLSCGAADQALRFQQFADDTALPEEQITATTMAAVPLPVKRRSAGPRGWAPELNPAMMWHPLFWLPERIALRYRHEDGNFESDGEWSARVALEATLTGLYDPAEGSWVDVLSLVELDVDDPDVQDRLSAWLAGADDESLDGIDLSGITELAEDPHWALEEIAELYPMLLPASWADFASGVLDLLAADEHSPADRVATAANLCLAFLGDVPPRAEGEPAPRAVFEHLLSAIAAGNPAVAIEEALSRVLRGIQEDYVPFLIALQEQAEVDAARSAASDRV